jgi:hypothetical protein
METTSTTGYHDPASEEPYCDVCCRIVDLYGSPYESGYRSELGTLAKVLESRCPHTTWITNDTIEPLDRYGQYVLNARKLAHSTGVSLGFHIRGTHQRTLDKVTTITEKNWISVTRSLELVARQDRPAHHGRSIVLNPQWIDLAVVRGWLSRCIQEHGVECDKPSWMKGVESVLPRRLVDVVQGCIVQFGDDKDKQYLALSYTWGQTTNLRSTRANLQELEQPEALRSTKFASQVPETIRNAIDVTRALGQRFLWVDSMCIIQDDTEEVDSQINNMHLIYGNSLLCLVAEVGRDAEYGLRGIPGSSGPRSVMQTIISLAGGERLSRLHPSKAPSESNFDYHRRAWTFQEYIFSKRRLIFNDGPLRWDCSCTVWREGLRCHPIADRDSDMRWEEARFAIRWTRSRIPSLANISGLIHAFNDRCLTYPQDVLRAFAGISAMLHRTYPGGLIFGHPEFFFDISLLWTTMTSVARRHPSSRPAARGPEHGPYGHIPSWSWMGWHGSLSFPCDLELQRTENYDQGFLEPVTQWYTMPSPQPGGPMMRKIESRWFEHKMLARGDGPLPPGWRRVVYKPPQRRKKDDLASLPRDLPRYSCVHESGPETEVWYPIPVPAEGDVVQLRPQTPYLYCVTERAFLFASRDVVFCNIMGVSITDGQGELVGILFLHEFFAARGQFESDPLANRVELIAVAKGWTAEIRRVTWLDSQNDVLSGANKQKNAASKGGRELDSKKSHEDIKKENKEQKPSDETDMWQESDNEVEQKPEWWNDGREDCYFVLWITWKDCVAYRQGYGRVFSAKWEKYKEKEPVELVLG